MQRKRDATPGWGFVLMSGSVVIVIGRIPWLDWNTGSPSTIWFEFPKANCHGIAVTRANTLVTSEVESGTGTMVLSGLALVMTL